MHDTSLFQFHIQQKHNHERHQLLQSQNTKFQMPSKIINSYNKHKFQKDKFTNIPHQTQVLNPPIFAHYLRLHINN